MEAKAKCDWTLDDNPMRDCYDTECGELVELDCGPIGWRFCPLCGGKLTLIVDLDLEDL